MKRLNTLKKYSRKNKNNLTRAEETFRKYLLSLNIHYKKQQVIRKFIIDFYLPKRNLIVEIDGGYHQYQKEYDEYREFCLKQWGWIILRFTNEQVIMDIKKCAEQILHEPETKYKYRLSKHRLAILNRQSIFTIEQLKGNAR